MTPDMADLESIMRTNRCANNHNVRSPEKMEAIVAFSHPEDTFGVLTNHVVSNEHLTEKERPMRTNKR